MIDPFDIIKHILYLIVRCWWQKKIFIFQFSFQTLCIRCAFEWSRQSSLMNFFFVLKFFWYFFFICNIRIVWSHPKKFFYIFLSFIFIFYVSSKKKRKDFFASFSKHSNFEKMKWFSNDFSFDVLSKMLCVRIPHNFHNPSHQSSWN